MEHSQLVRSYKIFTKEVEQPFELVRTLSNGDLIGKCYKDIESALTLIEVQKYIRANHIEEII